MRRICITFHDNMTPQEAASQVRAIADDLERNVTAGYWNRCNWEASG